MVQPSSPSSPFLFSVMDGHGGDEAANELHKLLPQKMDVNSLPDMSNVREISDAVIGRFIETDAELRRRLPSEEDCTAGATCTAALVSSSDEKWNIILANAGDSRSIVIRKADGSFVATEDHKPDNSTERERVERAGGFVSHDNFGPARVDSNLAVSRAFGDFKYKSVHSEPEDQKISCVPDIQHVVAANGDFILLCCDGIYDVMSSEECVEFVLGHEASDLGILCADLIKLVLEKGSKDNCSAMICQLGPPEESKEWDAIPASTTLDRSNWDGFDGYKTSMIMPGAMNQSDNSLREKFVAFHKHYGFQDPLPEPCSSCNSIFLGMQTCSRCKKSQYCSTVCQKKDWKSRHKNECAKK